MRCAKCLHSHGAVLTRTRTRRCGLRGYHQKLPKGQSVYSRNPTKHGRVFCQADGKEEIANVEELEKLAKESAQRVKELETREIYLISPRGDKIRVTKTPFLIGSGANCDLKIDGENVLEKHAELELWKTGVVIVRPLGGDPEDITSETYTSMDGNPLLSHVGYSATPDAKLQLGSGEETWRLSFVPKHNVNSATVIPMKVFLSNNFSEHARDVFDTTAGI